MPRICPQTFSIIIAALALSTFANAQSSAPTDLDSYVAASMKTFDVPGMAVAIVENSNTQLLGFEVNGLFSLAHDCSSHLELLAGVRKRHPHRELAQEVA